MRVLKEERKLRLSFGSYESPTLDQDLETLKVSYSGEKIKKYMFSNMERYLSQRKKVFDDIKQSSLELVDSTDHSLDNLPRRKLTLKELEHNLSQSNYYFNKELSDRTAIVYSKKFNHDFYFCFCVNSKGLSNKYVNADGVAFRFVPFIAIFQKKELEKKELEKKELEKKELEKKELIASISFSELFELDLFPFGVSFSHCWTNHELINSISCYTELFIKVEKALELETINTEYLNYC